MTKKLWLDFETFCEVPIRNGTHAYAEQAEIMLFAYALDDEPAKVWDCFAVDDMPSELWHALHDPQVEVWAHNSHFDRTVMKHAMPHICPPLHRWRDTMILATSHSLPGALGELSKVLGLAEDKAKDKDGKRLIQMFCQPTPANHKIRRYCKDTHPEDWARFVEYARLDIEAMREVYRKLPRWNYPHRVELTLWHIDQQINDRGVEVDMELVEAALKAVAIAQKELSDRTGEATFGVVAAATKRDQLLRYLGDAYGYHLDDLQGSTLERKLEDPTLDPWVRELLRLRLQSSTTSTAKYKALLKATSRDRRVRGLLQFNGASRTGRWAGRVFQPQNLPRPTLKDKVIEDGIDMLKAGGADLAYTTEHVMQLASSAIRGCLIAEPGKKLCISDLSNIEGRALAWLAGEQWKLDAFAAFDRGEGHDLYALSYAKSFGITPEEVMQNKKTGDGSMRQIGKVQELACLAGDTPVVTLLGVKALQSITTEDWLWDGKQWVQHQGLIAKGAKKVVNVAGIEVTPDHLIKTGRTWTQAQQLATCENTLSQALATGSENLPCWVLSAPSKARATSTWFGCSVPAALNRIWCSITTSVRAVVRGATPAPKSPLGTGAKIGGRTPPYAQMTNTAVACSIALLPQALGATAPRPSSTQDMAGGGFSFTNHGEKTRQLFWHTCSLLTGGMCQAMTWIGAMSTKATNPGTFGSYPLGKTGAATNARSAKCSSESSTLKPVFDILNSGPNNCFTVLSERGPFIVHNCGYEGGVGAFVTFAAGYGIDLDEMAVGVLQRADPELEKEARHMFAWFTQQKRDTYGLKEDTFVACDIIKRGWRNAHPNVALWWGELDTAFRDAIAHPGQEFTARTVVVDRPVAKSGKPMAWVRIKLPSGRYLCYPGAHIEYRKVHCPDCLGAGCHFCKGTGKVEDPKDKVGTIAYKGVDQYSRKWSTLKTYSGKLAENVTQAFARDVLAYNMPAIERDGYEIVLSVHDELLTETPDTGEFSSDRLSWHMSTVPPWAQGLPLAAAGFECTRYRKD